MREPFPQARGHLLAKIDPLGLTFAAKFIMKDKAKPTDAMIHEMTGLESSVVSRELGTVLGRCW